jgi:hypothetical protein
MTEYNSENSEKLLCRNLAGAELLGQCRFWKKDVYVSVAVLNKMSRDVYVPVYFAWKKGLITLWGAQ